MGEVYVPTLKLEISPKADIDIVSRCVYFGCNSAYEALRSSDELISHIFYARRYNNHPNAATFLWHIYHSNLNSLWEKNFREGFAYENSNFYKLSMWDQYSIIMATYGVDWFFRTKHSDEDLLNDLPGAMTKQMWNPPYNHFIAWPSWLQIATGFKDEAYAIDNAEIVEDIRREWEETGYPTNMIEVLYERMLKKKDAGY